MWASLPRDSCLSGGYAFLSSVFVHGATIIFLVMDGPYQGNSSVFVCFMCVCVCVCVCLCVFVCVCVCFCALTDLKFTARDQIDTEMCTIAWLKMYEMLFAYDLVPKGTTRD